MIGAVETSELVAFTRAVEAKSLSRAAAEMGVPRATVSRRLARLEERLGARLLRRSTRTLSLTDAGEVFYRHARMVLDAIAQAEASVRTTSQTMRGDLRVTVPSIGSVPGAEDSFYAMVTGFAKKHPDVRLQVEFSTRVVDLLHDGYHVALRATYEVQPGLVARTVSRDKVIAVASPKYLAESGTPRAAKDLRGHRCLTFFARGELPQCSWPCRGGVVNIESHFSSNEVGLLREAAVRGLGITLTPRHLVVDLIESGALVQVLPGIVEAPHQIAVVYPEREFLPAHIRAFAQSLFEWAPALNSNARGDSSPSPHPGRKTPRKPLSA